MTIMYTDFLLTVVKLVASAGCSYITMKYMLKLIESQITSNNNLAYEKLKKIGIDNIKHFNKHELKIAANLIVPDEINGSWKNIAGLDDIKKELNQTVIFPLKNRDKLSGSALLRPPKGILLHGPPGCGKTLIAKATAKEANINFINLDVSNLIDKWYGETPKLANAIFTFAEKIQPCIIFIDEIDSLLRNRSSSDHESTAQLKSIFLSKWDGLATDKTCNIVIMGATNRPDDIDPAIARRMPKKFLVELPKKEQRVAVLKLHLSSEDHALSEKMLIRIAEYTEGFSSNDLEELCRDCAGLRLQELNLEDNVEESESLPNLRKITMMDCMKVACTMKENIEKLQRVH